MTTTTKATVIGLDLSLTSTGVAGNTANGWTARIRPPGNLSGHERINYIRTVLLNEYLRGVDLVVVEGPSYRSSGAGSHERAGLWWLVTHGLWRDGIPTAVVPPNNRAQYATGMGDANKREVINAVSRLFPWFDTRPHAGLGDEADALVLVAMGTDRLGNPMAAVPDSHRAALRGCDWPDLPDTPTTLPADERSDPAGGRGTQPEIIP